VGKYLFWKKEIPADPKDELWGARCAPRGNVHGR
jgi:hypothetical protein